MHAVVVTFDEIIRPTRGGRGREAGIDFAFRSGHAVHYAVCGWGRPTLRNGMTVTAVFPYDEDWQALIGWVDHDTGEICCRDLLPSGGLVVGGPVLAFGFAHVFGRGALLLAAPVGALLAGAGAWQLGQVWRARRFLHARRAELARARDGGPA